MADDEAELGIQLPPGDPQAIHSQAAAMERASEAMSEMGSALSDPDSALVMSDGQWLALSAEVDVAQRKLAALVGSGQDVYGQELGRAIDELLEGMIVGLAAQRRRSEELWSLAQRERPNN